MPVQKKRFSVRKKTLTEKKICDRKMSCADLFDLIITSERLGVPMAFDVQTINWFWNNCLLIS